MKYSTIIIFIMLMIIGCAPINDSVIFNNHYDKDSSEDVNFGSSELTGRILMIDDFNKRHKNLLKGNVNAWKCRPTDNSQFTEIKYFRGIRRGDKGYSLRVDYDVDSEQEGSTFNGFYVELKGIDASSYNKVIFYVKGDKDKEFSSVIKIEIKNNANQSGNTFVRGIYDQWQKIVIPFSEFTGIDDFKSLKEFTVVFVDSEVTKKVGRLYFEDLYFSK